MKTAISFALALTLAVSTLAAAATTPTNSSANKNTTGAANTTNTKNTTTNTKASTQQLLKVSNEGFAAIRAIRAARVAIFNGQPTVAGNLLNKASVDLKTATKNAPTFVDAAEATVNGKVVAGAVEVELDSNRRPGLVG